MNTDIVKVKSSDGQSFDVPAEAAKRSGTLMGVMEDLEIPTGEAILLPNVSGEYLAKVLEYLIRQDAPDAGWNKTFVEEMDVPTLFEVILAANYMHIESLQDLTCQTVANMIKGKTPDEIRKLFLIQNDLTSQEEEEIRRENAWAFE